MSNIEIIFIQDTCKKSIKDEGSLIYKTFKIKFALILLLILVANTFFLRATSIDSLKYVLTHTNSGENQKVMLEIADFFVDLAGDSTFRYMNKIVDSRFSDYDNPGEIYYYIGKLFISKNQYERAYQNIMHANKLFQLKNDETGLAKVKIERAVIYLKYSDFDASIEILKNVIRYFKDNEMAAEESEAILKLGDVFYQLQQYDDAKELYQQSLQKLEEISDTTNIAELYFKIGQSNYSKADYEKSTSDFQKALKIFEQSDNQKGIADVYYQTALIYLRLDDFRKADENLGKSIKIYEKIEDLKGLAKSYLALSNYYLSMDDRTKGLYYLNEGLYAAEFSNSKDLLLEIYKNLSAYYEKDGSFEQAIGYYKNYSNLKDSLSKENQLLKLTQIKSRLEDEEKSKIIKDLEADSYFKEQSLQKNKNFLIASIISILLATIMVAILFTNIARRKKINQELTDKNISLQNAEDELIKANNELHKSEKRLKDIVQYMPVLVSATDKDGVFIFWNNASENITGYAAAEVINNSEFAKQIIRIAKKLREFNLNSGNTVLHAKEYQIITKNGERKDIVWTDMSEVYPIEGWADWHVGIDVTERNLFAKSLEEETAILNSILNSIPHPIFYKDKDGIYQKANPVFYQLHDLAETKLIGKTDKEVFESIDANSFAATDLHIFKNGIPIKELRKWKSADGEEFLLDTIKTPLYNSKDEVIGIVGISFDMTERYHIEQELKKQKEKAEEADRLKSAFLANMSHEIRSPMNAIIGFGNLVTDSFDLDSEIATYMEYIKQSGINLLQLVDDIIDIAKLEAGQLKIRKVQFDLDEMLQKLKLTIETSSGKLKKSHIQIILKIPEESENTVIVSDELRIKQVLNNFISNALKFTDEGFIEFGYEKMPDNEILFYTKDTGIGISENDKELIFERFGQVNETYARNTTGTGLGLAISKNIVELLDGQIWFDSIENIGTTFYFKIPVEYSSLTAVSVPEQKYDIANFNWKGKQILIVEDDDMNFNVLKLLLNKTNIAIQRAENGIDAVNMALSEKEFDLILMDIQLPVLNGYDATTRIKSEKNIPVIAVTAYSVSGEQEKSIESGCDYFITKPINRNELFHKMSVLLTKE